jgi:hypothetical protein
MSQKVIVVVGMHRSGTSVVASILSKLGVHLGNNLLGASFANPKGHYEDQDFLQLNKKILWNAKGEWDSPPDNRQLLNSWSRYKDEASSIIEKKCANEIWGWKEPRTSLMLHLYSEILKTFTVMYCRRDADDVASSLRKRNHFKMSYSKALKREYDQRIENFLAKNPSFPVMRIDYSELLLDPNSVARNIADFCGFQIDEEILNKCASQVKKRDEIRLKSKRLRKNFYLSRVLTKPWKILPHSYWRFRRLVWRLLWIRKQGL